MGYYDGPNLNEEHSETREVRKSGSKKAIFHRFSRNHFPPSIDSLILIICSTFLKINNKFYLKHIFITRY